MAAGGEHAPASARTHARIRLDCSHDMPGGKVRFEQTLALKPPGQGKTLLSALGAALLISLYASRGSYAIAVALLAVSAFGLPALLGVIERPRLRARVRVDDEEVVVARESRGAHTPPVQRIARATIASGFFRPVAAGGYVVLRDRSGGDLLEVAVRDEQQAIAFLEALDLDAASRLFSVDAASPITAMTGRAGGAVLGVVGLVALAAVSLMAGISPMFAVAAVSLAMLVGAWPARVEIASDGVGIAWLTKHRFVRFADLSTIARTARGALLVLGSGERVVLPRAVGKPGTDAMIARLREALDAYRQGGKGGAVPAHTVALVARGKRDVRSWLDDLRGMRGEGYRSAATRDDDLWRVVESPNAAADARAGAALLLRPTLDEAGRARIRVASEATASPKLRIALDAAAAEDAGDEIIEEHLEELAREEETQTRG